LKLAIHTTSVPRIITDMTATSELAQYAAVCATASLVLSIYLAYRDRSRITIPMWGFVTDQSAEGGPICRYVKIIIANVGRRPVSIIFASLWIARPTGRLEELQPKFVFLPGGELELAATRLFVRPIVIAEALSITFLYEFPVSDRTFDPIRTQVTDITNKTYNSIAIGGEYYYLQARYRLARNTVKNVMKRLRHGRAA
jgi:hypothetical protein